MSIGVLKRYFYLILELRMTLFSQNKPWTLIVATSGWQGRKNLTIRLVDKELFSDLICLNETIIINYREIHRNGLSSKITMFHFITEWKLELEEEFITPRGSITDLKHAHVPMFALLRVNSCPNNWQGIKSRISVNSETAQGVQTYTSLSLHLMKIVKGKKY